MIFFIYIKNHRPGPLSDSEIVLPNFENFSFSIFFQPKKTHKSFFFQVDFISPANDFSLSLNFSKKYSIKSTYDQRTLPRHENK